MSEWDKLYRLRYAAPKTREEALELATKMHRLAEDPGAQEGEKDNARIFRDRVMKTHGLNMDEIVHSINQSNGESGNTTQSSGFWDRMRRK